MYVPNRPQWQRAGCRGGHLPNQILTSKETAEFIAKAVERTGKKEQIKKEKMTFSKKLLHKNQKYKGLQKLGAGEGSRVGGEVGEFC